MKKLMLIGSIGLALTSTSVRAGLRSWEPADYVQTDLVLHYDGIRNAGADAAHDPDAAVWKDLSPSGNSATLKSNGVTTYGTSGWTDNGYMFYRNAWFLTDRAQSFEGDNGDFTIQAVVDFSQSAANLVSFPMVFDSSDGTTTIQAYWNNNSGQKKAYLLADKYTGASGGNTSGRPYLTSAWAGHYLTAAFATASGGGKDAWLFEGTTYPTAHPGYVKGGSTSTALNAKWAFGSIVSDSGRSDRLFTGKIQSIRAYSHKLTEAELAWNRALDEARFRGAASVPESALCASVIPDAVVATSVAGANGAESSGCYVVDEDGHTFRAAPFATVGSASYACTGYTLATWDGSAWGSAVAHDGEFSCFVAPGDKVKITWQWEAATGSLGAGGYVTDGLAFRFDGIDNAGFGVHDASATSWADLSGNGRDASLAAGDGSAWTDDGFYFNKNAAFATTTAFSLGTDYTVEILGDVAQADQSANAYVFNNTASAGGNNGFLYWHNDSKTFRSRLENVIGVAWAAHPGFVVATGGRASYMTLLVDGANTRCALVTGAAQPTTSGTSAGPSKNTVCTDWSKGDKAVAAAADTWTFGASNAAGTGNPLKGALKSIRGYSKLLSDDELAHNRAADEFRFGGSGIPPATGAVLVQSSVAGLEGREPSGLYAPDAWTFAAGTGRKTALGVEWECAGYQLQTWDADSATWGAQTSYESCYYTSPSGTAFDSVRLTWLWRPVSGIRTAADYAALDVSGYVAASALAWHLDGIRNAGLGVAHNSAATTWADLSGNGRDATLGGNGDDTSYWTDKGFYFNKNAVFNTAATFHLGKSYTINALVDVKQTDHVSGANGQILSNRGNANTETSGFIYYHANSKTVRSRVSNIMGIEWAKEPGVVVPDGGSVSYLTMLRDDARAAIVTDTAYPTTFGTPAGDTGNTVCTDWSVGTKSEVAAADVWRIGANSAGAGNNPLKGTIKSIRAYDRLLSEDELAWNRNVDQARFFGALTTTNVVVATKYGDGTGETLAEGVGAYEVFGAHTFSATEVKDPSEVLKPVAGCYVWTWKDGAWSEKTWHEGTSYDYTTDKGKVKIMWSPRPKGLALVLR